MLVNPAQSFQASAERNAKTVALRADGLEWSYSELADRAARLAATLHECGVGRSDLVVSRFISPASELIAFFALMHLGAVHCSIAHLGGADIEVAPVAVVGDDETLPALRKALPQSRAIHIDAIPSDGNDRPEFALVSPKEVSQLILTSGTTGRAKMVQLTYGAIDARSTIRSSYFPTQNGVLLLMGPMTAGGCQTVLSTLLAGYTLDLSRQTQGLADAIVSSDIGYIIASPVQLSGLLSIIGLPRKAQINMCGILLMGGAASSNLIEAASAAFDCAITVMYGTSEVGACAIVILDASRSADTAHLKPLSGVKIEVADDTGTPLAMGTSGKIRIATPGMAAGYFNDPVQTRTQFRDGWFYPGDLGRLDDDGLFLSGREDEVINLGGIKLDPAEIDRMIEASGLAFEAAAFRFVDGVGVERLMVASVTDGQDQFDRLRVIVTEHVGGRVPMGHFRVDRIPRNEMGKPLRRTLAAMLKHQLLKKN